MRGRDARGQRRWKAAVRAYLKAVARRDEILAGTTARDSALRSFAAVARGAGRALVVTPSPQIAAHVEHVLAGQGCVTLPAGDDGDGRNRRGGRGEDDRDVWQYVAPRDGAEPADQGVVDLAIMVTPPRSRRELVERMDRILGAQPAGGHVRVAVLYVEASVEDDTTSTDAQPVAEVMSRARRLQRFTSRDSRWAAGVPRRGPARGHAAAGLHGGAAAPGVRCAAGIDRPG